MRPRAADPSASFLRRWGKSALELDRTNRQPSCPDVWELDNGDVAIIGRDVTRAYESRLPADVSVAHDERVVVVPRATMIAAKADIPDA
jgi:hypothetical protein